jgi:hypothetical protein
VAKTLQQMTRPAVRWIEGMRGSADTFAFYIGDGNEDAFSALPEELRAQSQNTLHPVTYQQLALSKRLKIQHIIRTYLCY